MPPFANQRPLFSKDLAKNVTYKPKECFPELLMALNQFICIPAELTLTFLPFEQTHLTNNKSKMLANVFFLNSLEWHFLQPTAGERIWRPPFFIAFSVSS